MSSESSRKKIIAILKLILLVLIVAGIPAFLYLKYGSGVFSKDTAYSVIDYLRQNRKIAFLLIIGLQITQVVICVLPGQPIQFAASYMFPVTMKLGEAAQSDTVPQNVWEVLQNLLMKMVENPVSALVNGNYIGILFWAAVLGIGFAKVGAPETRRMLKDASEAVSMAVRGIINLAPFGICGLVYSTVSEYGLAIFKDYGQLLLVLVGCMMFVALVIDPLIAFLFLRRNPYPLVLRCLRESGITAFFTRSSAANIPVNMELCEKLGLDQDMYSVSIPLGATINMDGAAITITVMTLAAAHTMGIHVDVPSALFLSVLSTLAACGASGVAGGSLLLIPMACSLFGISNDVAMQVVGVGFIIGVVQDSVETMLNSSGDVMFAATAEYSTWIKEGRQDELPVFLGGKRQTEV